jgi:hypothetical protein
MGFFLSIIQRSISLPAHWERVFSPGLVKRVLASTLCLANKILFPGEEQRRIFQWTSKDDGASKKDRSEEGEGTLWQTVCVRNV